MQNLLSKLKSKKGNLQGGEKMITGVIIAVILVVVLFYLIAGLAPTLTDASDNLSASGLPLAGLFGSSGVIILIFMAVILLGVILFFMKMIKGRK